MTVSVPNPFPSSSGSVSAIRIPGLACNCSSSTCNCSACPTGYAGTLYPFTTPLLLEELGPCVRCQPGKPSSSSIAFWNTVVAYGLIQMYFMSLGMYQDVVGQTKCKRCQQGNYVPPWKIPKSPLDCQVCPTGTNTTQYAFSRACLCLDNHFRLERFGPCYICDAIGANCSYEHKTLKPGFWWYMNETTRDTYSQFVIHGNNYNFSTVNYTAVMPIIYRCRRGEACPGQNGNATSPVCADGCGGPL